MIEARKCVRCGAMYISENEVCVKCQKRDGADLYKLKDYIENVYGDVTQKELAVATGISDKNLERFLGYEEFKDVCIKEEISADILNKENGANEELV